MSKTCERLHKEIFQGRFIKFYLFSTPTVTLENPTPLQLAVAYKHESIVEYLLKWGANPNIRGDVTKIFIMFF